MSTTSPCVLTCLAACLMGCAQGVGPVAVQDGGCAALRQQHDQLAADRDDLHDILKAKIDRAYHGVAGITVSSITIPEMNAQAERERTEWRMQDAEDERRLVSIESLMQKAGCRP